MTDGGVEMTTATGSFEITGGNEDAYDEADDLRFTHASGQQSFTGGIEADGSVHWLMVYRPDKTAQFVGLQRISGTLDGRRGSFVLAAEGDHDGSTSRIRWRVVDGSGSGELAGITGEGTMDAPGGPGGTYRLDYTLGD
jgi:Protein of unknown function (DUF3224)